jgi:predicted cobalt transporter CbtA
VLRTLRRGLLAGAVGGLLAGAFGFLLAEPVMDRAVRLETARRTAAGDHAADLFDRHTQHVGFVVATFVVGLALGILYAVVHALLARAVAAEEPWGRALRLGGAGFFALSLVPFLRYPANPPGIGDAATIDSRAHLWLVSLVIGLVGVAFAALITRGLRERGVRPSLRQLAAAGVLAATVALTFVLPPNTDSIAAPVQLVWQFRLLSLATLVLLWGGLSAGFGLLEERASRRTP